MARRDEIEFGRILSRDEVLTILSDRIQDLNVFSTKLFERIER